MKKAIEEKLAILKEAKIQNLVDASMALTLLVVNGYSSQDKK